MNKLSVQSVSVVVCVILLALGVFVIISDARVFRKSYAELSASWRLEEIGHSRGENVLAMNITMAINGVKNIRSKRGRNDLTSVMIVYGFNGCRDYSAALESGFSVFNFHEIHEVSSENCSIFVSVDHQDFLAKLSQASKYVIEDGKLVLLSGQGDRLLVFIKDHDLDT